MGRRLLRLTLALLAVVPLAGCDSAGQEEAPEQPNESAIPSQAPDAAAIPGLPPGPLEVAMGQTFGGESVEERIAEIAARENQIAECMNTQGFEYWPNVPEPEDFTVSSGPLRGTREWAEVYGYGHFNPPIEEGGSNLSFGPEPEQVGYVNQLSEAEREAYTTALYGPVIWVDPDNGDIARGGGCSEVLARPTDSGLVAIEDAVNEFIYTLPSNSAFDDLNAEWATCMRGSGFTETSPYLAERRFSDLFNERATSGADGGPLGGVDQAKIAQEERAVALADYECREELGYFDRYNTIDWALQQDYLEDHQADIDAYAAASGSG